MKLKDLQVNDYFTLCPKPTRFTKIYRVICLQDNMGDCISYTVAEEMNTRVRLFPQTISVYKQEPFSVVVPNAITEEFVSYLNTHNHIVLSVQYNNKLDEVLYL